jgi:hypothetical protein
MLRTERANLNEVESNAALKFCIETDYMPLALEQAAAYIKRNEVGFANLYSSASQAARKTEAL